jgi:hypothetical protein
MEFGTLIPLFFIMACCIVLIPIAGFTLLAYIRFSLDDTQLAKNIFITVTGVGILSFLFPIVQLIWSLILIRQDSHCESSIELTAELVGEIFVSTLGYSTRRILPGVALGFILAICVVLPITLSVRYLKKRKTTSQ